MESAGRPLEAEALLSKRAFDLVAMCYSLTEEDHRKLMAQIGKLDPQPLVLALSAPGAPGIVNGADSHLVLNHGPYALLKRAAEMLGVDLKEKVKKREMPAAARRDRTARTTEAIKDGAME